MFAWVFFRSESISSGFEYLNIIVSKFSIPNGQRAGILFVFVLVIFDWSMRNNERNPISYKNKYFPYLVYLFMSYLVFAHFKLINLSQFIYFQF